VAHSAHLRNQPQEPLIKVCRMHARTQKRHAMAYTEAEFCAYDTFAQDVGAYEMCQDHAGRPLELYCEACRMLLCMECKVYGSHALGGNRDHRVLRLSEAAGTIRQQLRDV